MTPQVHIQRRRQSLAAVLGLVALALAAVALVGIDATALCVLPALALPALRALRRYPGERILASISTARRPRRARACTSVQLPACAEVLVPRGGLLLARSLAVRPPPGIRLAAG